MYIDGLQGDYIQIINKFWEKIKNNSYKKNNLTKT